MSGRTSDEQREQEDSSAPDIDGRALVRLTECQLGSSCTPASQLRALYRMKKDETCTVRRCSTPVCEGSFLTFALEHAGHAKVGQFQVAATVEQAILWLDVSVYDPFDIGQVVLSGSSVYFLSKSRTNETNDG